MSATEASRAFSALLDLLSEPADDGFAADVATVREMVDDAGGPWADG